MNSYTKSISLGIALTIGIGAILSFAFLAPPVNTYVPQTVEKVWNRVNVPDLTVQTAKSMGPGGKMNLVLNGIHSKEGIDDVQVYISMEAPDPDHPEQVFPALHNCGQIVIGNKVYNGNQKLDVSEAMHTLADYDPVFIRNVKVAFVVTPKNRSVVLNDDSFVVDDVYFEVFDKSGKPVPQPKSKAVAALKTAQTGKH